ncbi:MAG: gliding motility-associated-like protein [Saprospiraceae bacterium]
MCLCTFITLLGSTQCPDLPNNVQVNGTNDSDFALCGAQAVLFTVNDVNLPTGNIDWYSSTTSGFDPLTGGTLIGSSPINSADACQACPTIEAIYIDACGDEGRNEFVIASSGSGLAIDDLTFSFDVANNGGGSPPNGDINLGGTCGWAMGDLTLVVGCATMISVGPGDYIPPNSTLIIQTSDFGTTSYDVSGICGTSECIYVVKNSCQRIIGGFSNCGAGTGVTSLRVNMLGLACGCNDVLTYDILDPNFLAVCGVDGNGMHVFSDLTYANNGCDIGPNLGSIPQFSYSAVTDPFNHTFTNADCNTEQFIVGVLNSDQYNEDCCDVQVTDEYSFTISCPEAQLSGGGSLCPGECVEVDVLFTGGEPPYELNMQVTGSVFPIPFTIPGFEVDDKITICYDTGGPPFDPATNTANIPALFGGFSGTLDLLSFTDADGCAGTVTGSSVSIEFNDAPDVVTPPPFTECDMGDGTAFFILSDFNNIINDGSGLPVNYFSDAAGTMPISTPYQTGSTTIYAQVDGDPCDSELVPVILEVISNGDAGVVNMFCNTGDGNSTECTICDSDGIPGEEVTVTIAFQDGSVVYDYEVTLTTDSGINTITGTSNGGTGTVTVDIFETTTFLVTLVDPDNDCADMTNLGDPVTISYGIQPDMTNPGDLSNCGDIILPVIVGNEIPPNAGYYSMPGGMGTQFMAGDAISSSTTLYLYGGVEDCEQEFDLELTIETAGTIDDPGTITACGAYILPAISGTNIDNANYYTETNGGGSILPVGQNITASTTIFIFDPICSGAEVSFMVNITPGSVITTGPDTIVCDTFFLGIIEGFDLTGNETYYELSGGNGQEISVGDTITQDSTIYIYDNTPGCIIEIPFMITVAKPQFPGLDSSIVICEGDPTLYNINELLAGSPSDTTGVWIENSTSIISDSTMVDFSSLLAGAYTFDYIINDTICTDTSATLSVNIIGFVNAGVDTLLAVCENISGVNVYEILGNPDQGGIFVDNTGTPAPFDPANASFTTDNPGLIVYNYIVGDPSSSCGADTSIFSVITGSEIEAGDDVGATICAGSVLVLSSVLNNNSSLGEYSEPTISGGLEIIGNFNSSLVPGGVYTVYHVLAGSGQCPDDTAVITITVIDGPSAGEEQSLELCGGDLVIDLEDIIDPAAAPNGSFYFENVEITNTTIDFTGESGVQEYIYVVGNGVTCPFDTADILITVATIPIMSLAIDKNAICPGDCATFTLHVEATGVEEYTAYYSISGDDGFTDNRTATFVDVSSPLSVELCEGNGSQMNNFLIPGNSYLITFDSVLLNNSNCVYLPSLDTTLSVNENSDSLFQSTHCFGEDVMIGGQVFNQSNSSDVFIIPAINGCDSMITVDLTFLSSVPGDSIIMACEGEFVEVLGVIYTSSFSGDTTLIGSSTGGCDSIVTLDITILPNEMQNYSRTKCEGETEEVGGILFTETMNSGPATIIGGAANGCDLILNVFFTYVDAIEILIDTTVCDNFSIEIGGETFDISNPVDMVILPTSNMNECDTIVMIDLDFSISNVDSSIVFSTCDDNVFLQIGATTFNRTNPMGPAISSGENGECDTLFTVNITYGEMQVDLLEVDAGCEVIDSGSVIITNINGVAPYNIIYNGNNTIEFVLPIEIQLPIGTGELLITDNGGCQETIAYEILEGEEGDFSIVANGNQLMLIDGIADSVFWSPIASLSCIDCIDPIVNTSATTTYTAIVYFGGDCIIELDYIFEIEDNVPDYLVPSGFSPNNDGANDNFYLTITDGAIGIPQNMEIFDRWGNKVFVVAGDEIIQSGWDGTINGKDTTPGVYVYRIQVLKGEEIITLYGDVTLVR